MPPEQEQRPKNNRIEIIRIALNDEPVDPIPMPVTEFESARKLANGDSQELQRIIEGWARTNGLID